MMLQKLSVMVNVTKGILVECDPAMKQVHLSLHVMPLSQLICYNLLQFLLHLDEKFTLGSKFIIQASFFLHLQPLSD